MSDIEFVSKSTVYLNDYMGGDWQVVNSARVSFANDKHFMGPVDEDDAKLIAFLMKNRHGTPFESTVMTFRIETPIFVAREWFRHRIGSFNEMSGRYKKLPPRFFVPQHARTQSGKPGAYRYEEAKLETSVFLKQVLKSEYTDAWEQYEHLLHHGVAKEQARLVLPVGIMTQFYWTVNARSLMNFLELRLAPNAMKEIRECAEEVHRHFKDVAPRTCEAFDTYGKCP